MIGNPQQAKRDKRHKSSVYTSQNRYNMGVIGFGHQTSKLYLLYTRYLTIKFLPQSIITILLIALALPRYADQVVFVVPEGLSTKSTAAAEQLIKKVRLPLGVKKRRVTTQMLTESLTGKTLLITLGPKALKAVSKRKLQSPVISTFVSRSAFEETLSLIKADNISAIFSDPSPARQLLLAKALYGPAVRIGIAVSEETKFYVNEFIPLAKQLQLDLKIVDTGLLKNRNDFFRQNANFDAFLLVKDRLFLTFLPLDTILLRSYEVNRTGVIGFSSGVVNKGGLATSYSSSNHVANSLSLAIEEYFTDNELPTSRYTKGFDVRLNKYLQRSLNLPIVSEQQLKSLITSSVLEGSI